jgi:MarR family transcriptional regulator, lower aerobic nicotinate degradation pathway regulator
VTDAAATPRMDRRRNVVSVTPAGHAQFDRLEELLTGVQAELLAPLSPAERTELARLLTRMVDYRSGPAAR